MGPITTPGLSGSESNHKEGILHSLQIFRNGACSLVSYLGHLFLKESYPYSGEIWAAFSLPCQQGNNQQINYIYAMKRKLCNPNNKESEDIKRNYIKILLLEKM